MQNSGHLRLCQQPRAAHALRSDQQSKHKGKKYPCDSCDHQATKRGNLTSHKQARHEGKKYPCDSCAFQATERGSLTTQKLSKHEGKKYPS
jgi:predicted RNA-binding Zn-ribbon protein involved in translation (DUF1610 family)